MNLKRYLVLGCLSLLLFSCEEDEGPTIIKTTLSVELVTNESYQYDTEIGGDEDGATISTQANHFEVSEVVRNASTQWSPVYQYQPELDYIGSDQVELKISTGSDGASPHTRIEYLTINFDIQPE